MSHLGDVLSALVDGQLAPPEAERVLAHVAGCEPCADELRAARATHGALCGLAASSELAPDAGLTARLLALGAAAPVGQRPTHTAPGAGSLPLPGSGGRLGTLSGDLRPRRRPVVPVVAAVAGVGLLTACFTLGAEPDVAVEAQPGTVLQVLNAAAAAPVAPDRAELEAWFDDNPWAVPITVPGNHTVTGVQLGDGELEVDLAGPEGLVVVRQTRGRLAEVGTAVSLGDRQVRQVGDNPTYLAWQSGDAVITAMAEGPRWALAPVVAAYPVESYDDRASARLGRGWQILMTVWSGS